MENNEKSKRKKVNSVSFTLFNKGDVIDFQTVIEDVIGMEISKLSIYDANYDRKSIFNGIKVNDRDRAYFVADSDYVLTIKKKRNGK